MFPIEERLIENEPNTIIITKNGCSKLIINNITSNQSGKYSVEIMNSHSQDLSSASVAVEGPPDAPFALSYSKGSDRIAIAWSGPPYDGGCMLTRFLLEMQENNGSWQNVSSIEDSLAYTFENLKSGVKYRFRVRAENVHGHSEPSQPTEEIVLSKPSTGVEDDGLQGPQIRAGGEFRTRFEILEELGKGRFGLVYKVIEKESGTILAAKIIKCIKAIDRKKVQDEINIMKSLKHPKLLQLSASFETQKEIILVTECITGGELFERVVADDFTLTERDCILFIRQICEGVAYMHSQSVVHLDLKPENVLCYERTSHQIKIIDFGLATFLKPNDKPVRVLFGTPEFISPEIINYEPISCQSDMWSVGVICYVLLSGLSPFMGESDVETFTNITSAEYDFDDEAFDAVSEEAREFIAMLLVKRKEDRLTAKQCLASQWLSQHDDVMGNTKLCTDKLKKFIIRRKWQKTGNAIRALSRLATLSASRKNSSGYSLPKSPRPSISGAAGAVQTKSVKDSRMTILNEENDDAINPNLLSENYDKQKNTKTCNERSDSGFSECSSCSTPSASCVCSGASLENSGPAVENKITTSLTSTKESQLASETLAGPLELVVPTLELFVENNPTLKTVTPKNDVVLHAEPLKLETSKHEESTNELGKLKVFLEKTSKKAPTCKQVEQPKKNSKVAALMEKFEKTDFVSPMPSFRAKSTVANRESTGLSTNPMSVLCMTRNPKPAAQVATNTTTFRLSNRVREVTERLSKPKQLTSFEESSKNSILKHNTSLSKDFWKR